jgi:hypothetical protein
VPCRVFVTFQPSKETNEVAAAAEGYPKSEGSGLSTKYWIKMVARFDFVPLLMLILASNGPAETRAADCLPSQTVPQGRELWTRTLYTQTGRVLANIVGYVRLYGDQFSRDSYLALAMNQANDLYKSSRDCSNNHKLTLAGQCVVLTLNYTRTGPSVVYHGLTMHVRDDRNKKQTGGGWRMMCDFSPKFAFVHPKDRHYSCLDRRVHACHHEGEPVAELVLERFKLETNVPEDQFELEQFAYPPLENSCEYW